MGAKTFLTLSQAISHIRIRASLSIPYRERLANRLVTLFNDAKEEDFASPGITVGSLRSFYNFLRLQTNVKCPTISLTPEYNIYASWRIGQNRVFSVHFLPSGDARFVIFKPNEESLSVNWLEFLNCSSRECEIAELRNIYSAKLNVGLRAKIAILNVGKVREKVLTESPDRRNLEVLHDPSRQGRG